MRKASVMCAALALAVLTMAGCGRDRSGGPTGDPDDVVRAAPAITLRQRSASVAVESPDATSVGSVLFPEGGRLHLRGASFEADAAAGEPPVQAPLAVRRLELSDPVAVVDFVRGAVDVLAYGGGEVRGASTIRYSFDVDLDVAAADASTGPRRAAIRQIRADLGKPTFYADVWIDSAGRVRRVQIPVDPRQRRPGYTQAVLEKLITVDFYDYRPGG